MKRAMAVLAWVAAAMAMAMGAGLAGCAPPKTIVYGTAGTQYAAPDLCAALLACRKAGETSCSYTVYQVQDADGKIEEAACKTVASGK